jgi:hypothetical protein
MFSGVLTKSVTEYFLGENAGFEGVTRLFARQQLPPKHMTFRSTPNRRRNGPFPECRFDMPMI